jgi:hypothetical protein
MWSDRQRAAMAVLGIPGYRRRAPGRLSEEVSQMDEAPVPAQPELPPIKVALAPPLTRTTHDLKLSYRLVVCRRVILVAATESDFSPAEERLLQAICRLPALSVQRIESGQWPPLIGRRLADADSFARFLTHFSEAAVEEMGVALPLILLGAGAPVEELPDEPIQILEAPSLGEMLTAHDKKQQLWRLLRDLAWVESGA